VNLLADGFPDRRPNMTNRRVASIPLVVLTAVLCLPNARAAEPWADPHPPKLAGLELWLDASRLNAARQAQGQPALKSGDSVAAWPDASGQGRHLRQPNKAAQPCLIQIGDAWVVRFDGIDNHLRRTGLNRSLDAFTVFLVAAPHSNAGDFRGFLAINETGRRDYETGFTIDLGAGPGLHFSQLNVEGRGFGGARNLMDSSSPFGTLHVIEAVAAPDRKTVSLTFDGKAAAQRPFRPSALRMNEITIGARYYTNGPGAQQVRGWRAGDIAEVLLFSRVLTSAETKTVRSYLTAKYARLKEALPGTVKLAASGQPLVPVANPPPVQMFLPGFTVKELPVNLTNINNIRYRPDGKLMALAYDGNVYLLSDSDGDGLEDTVEVFWENKGRLRSPIGMALTPPGYQHGQGLFVASKGKCSLIVDSKGSGKADQEIVIAEGWKELPHGVDALGVAYDPRDGSVYFGLGCADYTNAYQVDKDGKAHYRLVSERGTIIKIAPDFQSRSIYCTGIRFSVGLTFNRIGDLFATDQEGATWLPNGNPFDELLQIQEGRHYGFPPRHPRHLPGVIDEPSVFDYGPQHQSTCGLCFNEPVNGGPVFGPGHWRGNALIPGYSRGKLYRTQLVKTPAGYVARNQLLACLKMLPVDACISPKGELVVAVHSGGPDWGSGPSGKGKLYKIFYGDPEHPQPVATWAAGPGEVRIAFDRALNPQQLKQLAGRTRITYGRYVRAGDRFESLVPGYAVVGMQKVTPRFDLPVLSTQVTSDRRTLILVTAPQREAVHYAVTLPRAALARTATRATGELPQHPQVDLDYTLNGVMATWQPQAPGAAWSGWLPHLDLDVARALTAGSSSHQQLWEALKRPGTLTLRTRLNLTDMLRPAVQPGSRIDYEWPAEKVTLVLASPSSLTVNGSPQPQLTVSPKANELVPVEVVLKTAARGAALNLSYHTAEDARPRALPLHRLLLPWADASEQGAEPVVRQRAAELEGGSWARGRKVFFSELAGCSKCHAVQGHGGAIGPDLSNLVQRDYQSVLRDVTEPSYAINPDYITYRVVLKNGRVLTGAVRTEGDKLLVGDEKGQVSTVKRDEVEQLQPSPRSIMPEGLPQALGPERMKDLMTFLLTEPPRMPRDAKERPPPPRSRAEVRAILAGAPKSPAKTRPLHIVLVAGRKDHGPGEHDYPAWQKVWQELLSAADDTRVTTAWDWPKAKDFRSADVMVFYQHGTWTPERARDIDAYLKRGGGLVYIHFAVDGGPDAPGFAQRIGLAWRGGQSKFRHGPLDLGFATGTSHPVARNFSKVHLHDESYWQLTGDPQRIRVLATAFEDGQPQPLFWTIEPGKGRVFVSIPGHYSWTFDDPLFRVLLLRGIAWSAREPVDRFNDLVTLGARLAD
jgi:putative heme-binding domain-containing protein